MITKEQAEECLEIVRKYIEEQTKLFPDDKNSTSYTPAQEFARYAAQELLDATDDDDLGGCSFCHS